ncbi:DUF4126 domain-containing protein [Planctomycetales bacterium ZRK34]|nr:DUF4126 domain-containing protein [Planctomycetales bacterium ZRK34]
MDQPAQLVTGLCIGVGLAAACGFRVFVPLLVMAVGARWGGVITDPGYEWVTSDIAIIGLSVATAVEIAAYYIPWVDNLLDTIATPMAVAAGSAAMATVLPDMGPMFKWGTALIAGGGTAGVVQGATVATRALSTATTGGVANPVVSTGENGSAVVMSILAIVIPIVVAILVLVVLIWAIRRIIRWRRNRRAAMAPDEPTPAV